MLQRLQRAVGWPVASPAHTRVNFQVTAQLGHGETLFVIGDASALGGSLEIQPNPRTNRNSTQQASSATEGVALVTTPELFPVWYNVAPVELRARTVVKYRYAVCRAGRFLRYETLPNQNRELHVKGSEISTRDELDVPNESTSNLYAAGPLVPRLSSGAAFHDRHVISGNSNTAASEGSVRRGQRRAFGPSATLTSIIPEDEEVEGILKHTTKPPVPISPVVKPPVKQRRRSTSDDYSHAGANVSIESTDGVIIVANYLPVIVQKVYLSPESSHYTWQIDWDEDDFLCPSSSKRLLKENMSMYTDGNTSNFSDATRLTWVGAIQCKDELLKTDEEELTEALAAFHCVPVFLRRCKEAFLKYSSDTLWPVFHNIVDVYGELPTRWWNANQQKDAWRSYTDANKIFVDKVIEVYHEGDLVWVHGIELLLTPSFLSRRLPFVNVGLFLHAPFPSSEIFRTLSVREELLRGMLNADHIGFHLYEYARHFLTSCRRILGVKYSGQSGGYVGVEYSGRKVAITISHIGISPQLIDHAFETEQVQQEIVQLRQKYKANGRLLIVGMDPIERLKGIPLKLRSIEAFLQSYPEMVHKISVVQIGIRNAYNRNSKTVDECGREIRQLVERINTAYPTNATPIVSFIEKEDTKISTRFPLWYIADIMLVTSIRDAVNLYPFEFVYSQHLAQKCGVTVLSEFSGSSRVLTGCLGINPWKVTEIGRALYVAVHMEQVEKKARHVKDLEYVKQNTRTIWAERVLVDLKRVRRDATEGECMGYGLGLGFRMMEFNAGFKMLDVDQVARMYRNSFRRVLLFDYGDTLVTVDNRDQFSKYVTSSSQQEKSATAAAPSHVAALLAKLCSDKRNTVFVLSGRDKGELETLLGDVKGLGLAAEHGYYYRWGDKQTDMWLCTKENFDDSWKDLTHSVMDIYTQRTHGTYIEIKGSALLWQFRDADPEFGQLQAKELQDQLTQVLEHFPVEVLMGGDYIEVRPEGVDKGNMADRVISTIESSTDRCADFVLCVGDDKSDEFMFSYLEDNRPRPQMYTCTVGKKPSAAKFYLNDVEAVVELLHSLTKVSTTANRNLSMNDLRNYDSTKAPTTRVSEMMLPPPTMLKAAKYSMSMGSLSTAGGGASTSATLEQYFSNLDEDDDHGGIFF